MIVKFFLDVAICCYYFGPNRNIFKKNKYDVNICYRNIRFLGVKSGIFHFHSTFNTKSNKQQVKTLIRQHIRQ